MLKNKIAAISFALILPAIVAIGAYMGTFITPLLLIAAICAVIVLVALGKISGRLLYLYIFGISLGLVWQTTMLGVDVVGSDIHNEFYFAKVNLHEAWNPFYRSSDNASLVVGVIAPFLSKLFMLDMVWVFKAVLPVFLALVPVVMFSVFKRMFGDMRAFFAAIFFMIIPVFSIEVAQIAKSMVAELFFALMVYVMVSDWRWPYKTIGIGGSLIMQVLCHYTIGAFGILFLLGVFLVRLVSSPLKWGLFANRKVHLGVMAVCLVLSCGSFWGYHKHTGNGAIWNTVSSLGSQYIGHHFQEPPDFVSIAGEKVQIVTQKIETVVQKLQPIEEEPQPIPTKPEETPAKIDPPKEKAAPLLGKRTSLVELAIGRDFIVMPVGGKTFRLLQFLTQLLIIIGVGRLVWSYKRYTVTAEFVGLVAASGVLLLICVVSGFAGAINMTRLYHMSLFFLAPMFVLGIETFASILRRND